jgi:pimeloyl-ACP methyl ester carboxylesterase
LTIRRIFYFTALILCLLVLGLLLVPALYLSGTRSFQEVAIPANGYEISGDLSLGNGPDGPWIVLGHGNRREGQAAELYQEIKRNFPVEATVLAIDFRGFGRSSADGMPEAAEIIDRTGDLEAAVAYLKEHHGAQDDRIILIGHSLGASQVIRMALAHRYALAVPIGLANWEIVLSDPKEMGRYINRFEANTGVALNHEVMLQEAEQLHPRLLFAGCPETPVVLVFGGLEESRKSLAAYYQVAQQRCGARLQTRSVFISGHMYETELYSLPAPLRRLVSRFSVSLLMVQLNRLIQDPFFFSSTL